jgi:predicted CoA-binding protein
MNARTIETPGEIRKLLETTRTIAVVGLSEKPERDSHSISAYFQARGYRIIGIHPRATSLLGEPAYASLSAVPEDERRKVDLVAIYRNPADVPGVIAEAARLGLKRVWLPPGASSDAALDEAARHGVEVVADVCMRVALSTLHPVER